MEKPFLHSPELPKCRQPWSPAHCPRPSPRHVRRRRVVHLSGAGAVLLRGRHREEEKRHFLECEQNHHCFTCRNASSLSLVSRPAPAREIRQKCSCHKIFTCRQPLKVLLLYSGTQSLVTVVLSLTLVAYLHENIIFKREYSRPEKKSD